MDNKCVKCGGELVEGSLASAHLICFYPKGEERKLRPKAVKTVCSCCKVCGLIQNIRVVNPEKLP